MSYWDSVGRWINTLLLFIVAVIGFDTLFRLLNAQDRNVIVGVTHVLATIFLVPFRGMFGDQDYILTAAFAVLGYAILVGIALSVLRGAQATRVNARPVPDARPQTAPTRSATGTAQRTGQQRPGTRRADAGGRGSTPPRPSTTSATTPRPDGAARNGRAATAPRRTPDATPAASAATAPGKAATTSAATTAGKTATAPTGKPAKPAAEATTTRDSAAVERERGDA